MSYNIYMRLDRRLPKKMCIKGLVASLLSMQHKSSRAFLFFNPYEKPVRQPLPDTGFTTNWGDQSSGKATHTACRSSTTLFHAKWHTIIGLPTFCEPYRGMYGFDACLSSTIVGKFDMFRTVSSAPSRIMVESITLLLFFFLSYYCDNVL